MEVIKYDHSWSEKWDNFIDYSKNGSFLFKRNFMEYHADRYEDYSLMVVDANQIIALLPANINAGLVYSHQGLTYGGVVVGISTKMPVILDIFKNIIQHLAENGIEKLFLKPIPKIYNTYHADEIDWALTITKAMLYRRDSTLTINNEHPLPFQERRMRSIKKAQKVKPIIIEEELSGYDIFWEKVLIPNMHQKHNLKPVHSIEEIKSLAQLFPENIKQYNIYINGEIMAGCTMFLNQRVAHAQYISGTEIGRKNGCLDFLFNFLITEKFKSYKYFDFGNSNEEGGTKINFGLMNWKEGFGARAISHDFYEIKTDNFNILNTIYEFKNH
jgi:hypothetical protein